MELKEKLKKEGFSNVDYLSNVADEFAIGFAEWKEKNNYWYSKDNKCHFKYDDKQTKYTTKELLEIYKNK
jgi:hypothetical protein